MCWVAWSLVFVDMVNSNSSTTHLLPSHGDDEQESRTTLFEAGGDDVARVTSITMSSTPTYHKATLSLKVNSFLYENPFRAPLDGILLEHLPLCYARYHMTSTTIREDAEEAKESRPSKAYAWKRRRKRQDEEEEEQEEVPQRYYRPSRRYYRSGGTTAPSAAENPPLRPCAALPAVLPPALAVLPR